MDIVSTYKQSTNKFAVVEKIALETGMAPKDIFLELLNAHAIDGRMFRQGRYKDDWTAAKKEYKNGNINTAKEATTSLEALKKENAELKKFIENVEVPDSYQKTIDAQQKEIERLKEEIEGLNMENVSLGENVEALKSMLESSSGDALIEDLNSVIKLREDEIKELNEKIAVYETDLWDVLDKTNLIFGNTFCERSESNIVAEAEMLYESVKALDESAKRVRDEKIEELENRIKHLKVSDFNATANGMVLESKLKTAEDKNAKLLERIRGLEEENEELRCTNCADDIKKQLDLLEEEKESDGAIIVDQAKRIASLEKKLRAAEQYVLNQVLYGVQA